MYIKIKAKKIYPYSKLPHRAEDDEGNLCFDVYCDTPFTIAPGEIKLVGTGIMVDMPKGVGIRILERSSSPLKKNIEVKAGTIDSNFTQFEVKIMVKKFEPISFWQACRIAKSKMTSFRLNPGNYVNKSYADLKFKKIIQWTKILPAAWKLWRERNSTDYYDAGERIAQMLIVPSLKAQFCSVPVTRKTNRTGGFGSTGK